MGMRKKSQEMPKALNKTNRKIMLMVILRNELIDILIYLNSLLKSSILNYVLNRIP